MNSRQDRPNFFSGGAKRHILPFFIPMEGCPHQCIFCDQKSLSGQEKAPALSAIREAALACRDSDMQLAFYGGSFSALPRARQEAYLSAVREALEAGSIASVRISTRPDYIDEQELDFLAGYGVKTIELGIQSFNAGVLAACGRFYSTAQARDACLLVKKKGFELGIQLMTGLCESDYHKDLASAKAAVDLLPDMVRIYPTLVLEDTPLAGLWREGKYNPQTLAQAVACCRDMAALFASAEIPVIRMGINPSPQTEKALLDGPYHPAFGHLVRCALKQEQLRLLMLGVGENKGEILLPPSDLTLAVGYEKAGEKWLRDNYGPDLRLGMKKDLPSGSVAWRRDAGAPRQTVFSWKDFLASYKQEVLS